jgi:hypothetical protein
VSETYQETLNNLTNGNTTSMQHSAKVIKRVHKLEHQLASSNNRYIYAKRKVLVLIFFIIINDLF